MRNAISADDETGRGDGAGAGGEVWVKIRKPKGLVKFC